MSHRLAIRFATVIFAFGWLAFAAGPVAAQKVYRWKDKQGKVHFSNVAPSGEPAEMIGGDEPPVPARPPTQPSVQQPEAATSEAAPAAPATPKAKESAFASLSEEQFSNQVTDKRQRLKREIIDTRRRIGAIDQELARIRNARNKTLDEAMKMAGVTYPAQPDSTEEADLKKDRETSEKRIREIKKEYDELRDEAVRRFGHQPPWWVALE